MMSATDPASQRSKLDKLEAQASAEGFWDQQDKAAAVNQEMSDINELLELTANMQSQLEDVQIAVELIDMEVSVLISGIDVLQSAISLACETAMTADSSDCKPLICIFVVNRSQIGKRNKASSLKPLAPCNSLPKLWSNGRLSSYWAGSMTRWVLYCQYRSGGIPSPCHIILTQVRVGQYLYRAS